MKTLSLFVGFRLCHSETLIFKSLTQILNIVYSMRDFHDSFIRVEQLYTRDEVWNAVLSYNNALPPHGTRMTNDDLKEWFNKNVPIIEQQLKQHCIAGNNPCNKSTVCGCPISPEQKERTAQHYSKDEIRQWLKRRGYSDQIADELSVLYCEQIDLAFKKGKEIHTALVETLEKQLSERDKVIQDLRDEIRINRAIE